MSEIKKIINFDFSSLYPNTQRVISIKSIRRKNKIRKIFRSQIN